MTWPANKSAQRNPGEKLSGQCDFGLLAFSPFLFQRTNNIYSRGNDVIPLRPPFFALFFQFSLFFSFSSRFVMVFLCLGLSVFSTIENHEYEVEAEAILFNLEIVIVIWFGCEFVVR